MASVMHLPRQYSQVTGVTCIRLYFHIFREAMTARGYRRKVALWRDLSAVLTNFGAVQAVREEDQVLSRR
jgi:hypothetical protein